MFVVPEKKKRGRKAKTDKPVEETTGKKEKPGAKPKTPLNKTETTAKASKKTAENP